MSKRDIAHSTARGGYGSEQGIPLSMVSNIALVEELNRRNIMMNIDKPTRLRLVSGTKRLTLEYKRGEL